MTSWTRGDSPFDLTLRKHQVRNILEYAKGGSLLDLGCNNGQLAWSLILQAPSLFTRVVGVDAEKTWEGKFSVEAVDTEFVCSAIEDFDCEERFDTITLINVLEHVEDPVLVLEKTKGWLTPDGVVIIHVPNARGLNRRLGIEAGMIQNIYELSEQDRAIGHRRLYDQRLLRTHICEARLCLQEIGGIFLKPFSSAQMQVIADEWEDSERIFEGLYELAEELPEYSSPIWAVCTK